MPVPEIILKKGWGKGGNGNAAPPAAIRARAANDGISMAWLTPYETHVKIKFRILWSYLT